MSQMGYGQINVVVVLRGGSMRTIGCVDYGQAEALLAEILSGSMWPVDDIENAYIA
mgnify:CR=1 FL=1